MGSLTKEQKSIILGSVLGDGYVRIIPGRKNAFLEINHSIHQKKYVDWKYDKLKDICLSGPKIHSSSNNRLAYRFTTSQNEEITEIL